MERKLPIGWASVELGDVVPKPRPKVPPDPKSSLPFIGMDHIEPNSFHLIGKSQFSEMKSAGSYFMPGDVLYGRLRPYLNKVHLAKFEGVASAEFIVLPEPDVADGQFIKYLLHQREFVNHAMSRASGDRPRVKFNGLADFEFALPPLNEQNRIVEKIETLFARIDKGEEALREVRKLLKRYRQSILKAAVTGELTRDWREANQHKLEPANDLLARILKARRENWQGRGKYQEPTAPESDQFSKLPKSWTLSTTEYLAFVETGATPKKSESSYYSAQGIPWITSTAVNEDPIQTPQAHISEKALRETNAKVFPTGALIVAMYGEGKTRGKVSELGIESATNQACAALLVQHLPFNVVRYLKLFYLYNYEAIRRQSAGGVQPNLNLSIIKGTQVPLPSEEEIGEILTRVNAELSRVDDSEMICSNEIRRSAALRQSILKSAFTGQLVPQDPNDEPASELLARIRADA